MISYPFDKRSAALIQKKLKEEHGTVVFPTETFYALGCDATSSRAVNKIYQLKQRSIKEPLLILIDSWEMLNKYVDNISSQQLQLLEKYWPGPLTAILDSNGKLSEALNTSTGCKIAFRMTSNPIALEMIHHLNIPLVGTSANISGQSPVIDPQAAWDYFANQVDLYIDGGKTPGGAPSTIIAFDQDDQFSVLRKGAIDLE